MSVKKLIHDLKRRHETREKFPELKVDEVLNIISFVFESHEYKKGSHIVVRDSRFKRYREICEYCNDYTIDGEFTIPVVSGQKVIVLYVKRLIKAIIDCEQMEAKGEKESRKER
jgi:hypothetical protein